MMPPTLPTDAFSAGPPSPDIEHTHVGNLCVTLYDWLQDGLNEYDLDAGDCDNVPIGFWGPVAPAVVVDLRGDDCCICHDAFDPEEPGDEQLCCGNCGHPFCGLCIRNMRVDVRTPCPMCRERLGELRRFDRV